MRAPAAGCDPAGGRPLPPLASRCPRRRAGPATAAASAAGRLALDLGLVDAPVDGVGVDDEAAAVAVLARLGEDLDEPGADPLAGHLDEAERGHLGDLVLRAVAAEALEQPAHDEVAVALEDHVDEVDDDDAADVAQPQLADDLLGRLDVVLGDRLLEVAARADELARVDVDDRHRLGAVDDERAAARQPDLAVHGLGELLVDPVVDEEVLLGGPLRQPVGEVRRDRGDVGVDLVPGLVALDDELLEVLVEDVADDPDREVRLAVQEHRRRARGHSSRVPPFFFLPLLLPAVGWRTPRPGPGSPPTCSSAARRRRAAPPRSPPRPRCAR